MTLPPARCWLAAWLLALALLYAWWFHDDRQRIAALVVFALPPLCLCISVLRGHARAAFWSGLLGLLWFSHGVMAAYGRPGERGVALAATALAVAIVLVASWPGLRARFGKRKAQAPG